MIHEINTTRLAKATHMPYPYDDKATKKTAQIGIQNKYYKSQARPSQMYQSEGPASDTNLKLIWG